MHTRHHCSTGVTSAGAGKLFKKTTRGAHGPGDGDDTHVDISASGDFNGGGSGAVTQGTS